MFIVAEDCEAHSLLKGQSLKLEEIGDDDEAWKREHGRKDDKGDDDNKLQEPKLSEQQTRKQRTLLKLRRYLQGWRSRIQWQRDFNQRRLPRC